MNSSTTLQSTPTAPKASSPGGEASAAKRAQEWLRDTLGENTRLLPIVAGWLILAIIFQADTGFFFTSRNLSNLFLQSTVTGVIALGLVFVLLIGEIDLSVAANSGFSATLMGSILVVHHQPFALALIAALVVGGIIGAIQGAWCNLFGIPSFVVTLGVSLVLNAGALSLVPNQGQISLLGTSATGLTEHYIHGATLLLIYALSVVAYAGFRFWLLSTQRREKLPANLVTTLVIPVALVAVLGAALVAIFDKSGGMPVAVGVFFALAVAASILLRYTKLGISMYAVGGNREAARRSGIKVDRVRVIAFALAGVLAALGGLISASRILGITTTLGGGSLLLDSIAAAVIGGMSLFGGQGRAAAAILGAIIVETVGNGLNLMNAGPAVVYAATGGLLVLAVTLDGITGRRRKASR